jgi:WD40 repeat protein
VAWSRDGRRLALSKKQMIDIWDVGVGKKTLSILREGEGQITNHSWAPDNLRLASAGSGLSITVHDATTGRMLVTLPGKLPLAWSPDGKRLAASGEGQIVKLWDVASAKEISTLRGHDVLALAWSPDGRRVASAGGDRTIKVWDATSSQNLVTLRGHEGPIHSVAWSPDGRRLASVSHDAQPGPQHPRALPRGALKLWDPTSGVEIQSWPGQMGPALWSPDGRSLASVTLLMAPKDIVLTVWDATPRAEETPDKNVPKGP